MRRTASKVEETASVTSAIEAAFKAIRAAVGPKGVVDDPQELERYLSETRGMYRGRTGLVVRPASTAEVAEVVRLPAAARLPIVPQSGTPRPHPRPPPPDQPPLPPNPPPLHHP